MYSHCNSAHKPKRLPGQIWDGYRHICEIWALHHKWTRVESQTKISDPLWMKNLSTTIKKSAWNDKIANKNFLPSQQGFWTYSIFVSTIFKAFLVLKSWSRHLNSPQMSCSKVFTVFNSVKSLLCMLTTFQKIREMWNFCTGFA